MLTISKLLLDYVQHGSYVRIADLADTIRKHKAVLRDLRLGDADFRFAGDTGPSTVSYGNLRMSRGNLRPTDLLNRFGTGFDVRQSG